MELLNALHNDVQQNQYVPGDTDILVMPKPFNWWSMVKSLVKEYIHVFADNEFISAPKVIGWKPKNQTEEFFAVVHPLWSSTSGQGNCIQQIVDYASCANFVKVYFIDSFIFKRFTSVDSGEKKSMAIPVIGV